MFVIAIKRVIYQPLGVKHCTVHGKYDVVKVLQMLAQDTTKYYPLQRF